MTDAARRVLHTAILRDSTLPVAGWEHVFTGMGDGEGRFYFTNEDARLDLLVTTTAEGQTSIVSDHD